MGADRQRSAVAVAILAAAGIALAPIMAPGGYILANDSVAVPSQDLLPWMWGAGGAPPRSVPQDAIVAALDNVIPGWMVQRALVIGAVLLLGFGVARLLQGRSRFEQAGAAITAMWSAYVFERSAMGHWGLLLGLGCLPWLLAACSDTRDGVRGAPARAVMWTAVASLVPSSGALQVVSALAVLAWPGRRAVRPSLVALAGILGLQLPWVTSGILNQGVSSAEAAEVFALRPQGVAGPVLTALGTGGVWNAGAVAPSREGLMSVLAPLVLLALAGAGVSRLRCLRPPVLGSLAVLSVGGFAWALLTALPAAKPLVLAVEALPGGGLLRDAQKWLAPWLVLLSIAVGLGMGRIRSRVAATEARLPVSALLLLAPLLLLPDLAFGMWGRMAPVSYPDDWQQVRVALDRSDAPGDVVSWPWSAFRAHPWNGQRTVLDPAPRFMPRTVVTDSRLLVEGEDGPIIVPSDDPRSQAVGDALLGANPAGRLRELGIGWVLVQVGQPPAPGFPSQLPESLSGASRIVVDTPTLELRQVLGPIETPDANPTWPVRVAWLIWLCLLLAGVLGLVGRSLARIALGRGNGPLDSASLRATDGS